MFKISLYCPNCQNIKHEPQAAFCFLCGTALKNGSLLEFYQSLKIPSAKISTENKISEFYTFSGFPFYLYKHEPINKTVELITFHEYPKGCRLYVKLPAKSSQADCSREIHLTEDVLDELLKEGFEWFHQTERETLW